MLDFAANNASTPNALAARTAAAKLHVLHLGPIKEKLGPKWPKLAEPVHRLFEKAIRNAQGPRDHFIQLDELSYVVTFNGLAFEEAALACAAIAKQVSDRLFGGTNTGITVRALVGQLSEDILASQFMDGSQISALLELNGQEIVVSAHEGIPPSTTRVTPGANDTAWQPLHTITKAVSALQSLGLEMGLFPVWELAKTKSACLYASAYPRHARPKMGCTRQMLSWLPDKVVDAEITILYAAHAYAHRIHNAHKVCALGAAVSYETLTNFNSRIRYITALKSLTLPAQCPILLKLDDVPPGTPLGKLAELISMLSIPNLRFTVQFKSFVAVPDTIDIRLGAVGIGCAIPSRCDEALATVVMKRLTQVFAEQKGFVFVEDLDTPTLAALALSTGVRFGTGQGLSEIWFSGIDQVPTFPLSYGCMA
jgi:hypothetical protein